MSLAVFVYALLGDGRPNLPSEDQAMLIVSVPEVVGDLGGLQSFAWIFTIYFLSTTVTIPIWGKLSDQYGRRPLLSLAVVFFIVGSLICALAPTLPVLLAGRALQGIGAGGIVPIGMAATADIMSPLERGKWIGYQSAVLLVSQLGGPAFGGLITDAAGWRWAFSSRLPLPWWRRSRVTTFRPRNAAASTATC